MGQVAETYEGTDPSWLFPSYGVTLWPWRLARIRTDTGFRYELYDLALDPGETRNLYPERGSEVQALQQSLDIYEPTAQSVNMALNRGRPDASANRLDPSTLDDARKEKLRALGYLH
jgi:hypothetical protein